MIDHTFVLDWRHVLPPLALTGLVIGAALGLAFLV